MDRATELATAHADWLFDLLRKVYIDAMVHGYGHGYEDAKADEQASKGVSE